MGKDKKKKAEDSSSSVPGPSGINPPPAKKVTSNASVPSTETDEEGFWNLERNRFVTVEESHGQVFVDIREYHETDGQLVPGNRGISLSAAQWEKLMEIVSEIDEALEKKS